jgi:8-oxo-dGTP pyrophosphatase MutT (NUDIX family)
VHNDRVAPSFPRFQSDLDAYSAADEIEQASLARIREFVARSPDPFSRSNPEGHITASAVVADPRAPAFLLVWHRKLGRWLQPGGHLEDGDLSVLATALREAQEETSIEDFAQPIGDRILDVDVHPIPAHGPDPAHFHFDIRFLLTPTDPAPSRLADAAWFSPAEALSSSDDSLRRALRKAISRLSPKQPSQPVEQSINTPGQRVVRQ